MRLHKRAIDGRLLPEGGHWTTPTPGIYTLEGYWSSARGSLLLGSSIMPITAHQESWLGLLGPEPIPIRLRF